MTLVVLADVTTPESLVASQLVDRLLDHRVDVAWRAVQAAGTHLFTTRPLPADGAVARSERVRALAAEFEIHLPEPWTHPTTLPSNAPAVAALAEADCSGVLRSVRQRLFRAYWMDRLDIGNPDTLRTLLSLHFLRGIQRPSPVGDFGYAVSIGGGPVTTLGWRRMHEWQQLWVDSGKPELPAVLGSGDGVVSGEAALQVLHDAIPATAGAAPDTTDQTLAGRAAARTAATHHEPGTTVALTASANATLLAHERWLRGLQRRSWRWADPSVQFWWLRPDP